MEEETQTTEATETEETEETTTEEEVVIPEETQEKIASKVAAKMQPMFEQVARKSVGNADASVDGTQAKSGLSREVKFVKYLKALRDGDIAELKALNEGNATAGGNLVPPSELIAEVLRLEEQYGVALRDANVRRNITGNSFTLITKTGGISMYETDELEAKTLDQPTFGQVVVTLKKYAVIVPVSEELEEDAAVDIWNEVTAEIARAKAQKADELVFTEATTGILDLAGTNEVIVTGANFADITYDNLVDMIYGVPSDSARGGKFYMHRSIAGVIAKIIDGDDRPIFLNSSVTGGAPTILGYPIEWVEVMPTIDDDALDTAFVVFGNLKYFTLGMKRDLQLKMLEEGTIGTGGGAINLASQDARALRGVVRMAGKASFASAFSVLKTNASS